jgi:hypothetical protein
VTQSTNSILFTKLNSSSSNIQAQTFTLIVNGIQNPPSTSTTSPFTITTYYNTNLNAIVCTGSVLGVTPTASTLDSTKVIIASSSPITSTTGVTYYISFVVGDDIPVGGSITTNFPSTITFNTGVAASNCQIMINSNSPINTPCTASLTTSYLFTFTNPFQSTGASVNTNVTLVIGNAATNPATTAPVSPFSISTFHSDGTAISNLFNSLSYALTTPNPFSYNLLSRISNKNAELTTYTLNLTQVADL